jgi:hypothetical protein
MFTVPALRLRCAQSWMRDDTMANNPVTRRTALGAAAVGAARLRRRRRALSNAACGYFGARMLALLAIVSRLPVSVLLKVS